MNNDLNLTETQKEELKNIVLARIQVMPEDVSLSIGGEEISKKDLMNHVEQNDTIGEHLMITELEFLQDLASGAIYKDE